MSRRLPGGWRICQVAGALLWAQALWAAGATDAVLCESVNGKGLAVGTEKWFAAGRDALTVWFKVGDVPPGSVAEIRWLLNGATLTTREIKLSPPGKSSWCRYSAPEGETLMPGRYEAQVSIGGKVEVRANGQVGGTRPEGDELAGAAGLVRRDPTPEVSPAEATTTASAGPGATEPPALAQEPDRLTIAPQVPLAALHVPEPDAAPTPSGPVTAPPIPAPAGSTTAALPVTSPLAPTVPTLPALPSMGDDGGLVTPIVQAPLAPETPVKPTTAEAPAPDPDAVVEPPTLRTQRVLMPRATGAESRPVVTKPRPLSSRPQSEVKVGGPVAPASATHTPLTGTSGHAPQPTTPAPRVTLGSPGPAATTPPATVAGPTIRRPTAADLAPLPLPGTTSVAPSDEAGTPGPTVAPGDGTTPVEDPGTTAASGAPVAPAPPDTTPQGPPPEPTAPQVPDVPLPGGGQDTAPAVDPGVTRPAPDEVTPPWSWVASRPALAEMVAEDLPPVGLGEDAVKLNLVTLEALADPVGLQPLWVPRAPDGRLWPPGLPTQLGLYAGAAPEPSPADLLLYADHLDGITPLYSVPRGEAAALADRENDATVLTAGREVYDERRPAWQSSSRHWQAAWYVREVDLAAGETLVAALSDMKRSRRAPEDWQPATAPQSVLLDPNGQQVAPAEPDGEMLAVLATELGGAQAGLPAGPELAADDLAAGLKARGLSGFGVWVAPAAGRYQVWALLPMDACTARSWVWTRAR